MQLISLYDFLTIKVMDMPNRSIKLSGTNSDIPYDNRNLVYKAVELFLDEAKIENVAVEIYIEKNIPISAGLAGGSTDAAGTLFGLNHIFKVFEDSKLNELCAKLGSDLNVCLNGGCVLATSRGEVIQKMPNLQSDVTLIKPKNLGISAAEAYKKYSLKEFKPKNNFTEKFISALENSEDFKQYLYNDLEYAVFDDYKELQEIKANYPKSIMSGSGSTYFILENCEKSLLSDEYAVRKLLSQ